MKSRVYVQTVNVGEAKSLIFCDLFGNIPISEDKYPHSLRRLVIKETPSYEKRVALIIGAKGNVYTGFLERIAEEGETIYGNNGLNQSLLRLSFVFGENQETKPLDDRVKEYGFVLV